MQAYLFNNVVYLERPCKSAIEVMLEESLIQDIKDSHEIYDDVEEDDFDCGKSRSIIQEMFDKGHISMEQIKAKVVEMSTKLGGRENTEYDAYVMFLTRNLEYDDFVEFMTTF